MKRCCARGLTLIELVITISLAGILGIPVGWLLSEQLSSALTARDAVVAMSLARYEMERLDSLGNVPGQENTTGFCHPDLNVNSPVGLPIDPYQGYRYALTRIIWCQMGDCTSNCASPSNTNNGIKRIEVFVTKSGSSSRLATLVTYRAKYILFGP